jgi:hypothetical protein
MPNPFTTPSRDAMYQQETGEAFVVLITITHPIIAAEPIRVCSNATDVLSRGLTFFAYPFQLQLPSSDPTQPPKAQLKIDNVTPEIINALRGLDTSPTVTFEIIRAKQPNIIEISMPNFILNSVQYDSLTITGDISVEQYLTEPYPKGTYSPGYFPGLFGISSTANQ